MDKEIADLFSQINSIVSKKRTIQTEGKLQFKNLKKGDILVGKFPPYKEMEVISSTDKSAKAKSSKGGVVDIYSTNNYELKENSMKLSKLLNEQNLSFNKYLLKFIDDYVESKEFPKGSPEYQWVLATLLSLTLTDANFHKEAKKAKSVFRRAEEPDNSKNLETLLGMTASNIAKKAKWDGHDIIDGFAYVAAMRIGGPVMGNVTALKTEGVIKEDANQKNPKFKVGQVVNYIPKLSGLSPKKKLKINKVRFEKGDTLTKPGWYYSFDGMNLGSHENDIKLVETIKENTEPQIITQLRDVMKSGYKTLKDPKSGRKMKVDSYSASAIVKVYDALKDPKNKEKFSSMGLLGMQSTAFKFVK